MSIKIYKRKPDCVHYDKCLTEAGIKDTSLQCSVCRRYRFKRMEFDPFRNKETVINYLYDETLISIYS